MSRLIVTLVIFSKNTIYIYPRFLDAVINTVILGRSLAGVAIINSTIDSIEIMCYKSFIR